MTKYLEPSFTVAGGYSKQGRENFDRIFPSKRQPNEITCPHGITNGIPVAGYVCETCRDPRSRFQRTLRGERVDD